MDAGKEAESDFYAVLGLKKDCSATELRSAYKKLALRWHPDRCSNSGSNKHVEESKKKFQAVQEAYSVLSDANKRFLYDVGIYDSDEEDGDDETGIYKNLLQENAHRAGLNLPVYTPVRSGPRHMPMFTCTIELAGMTFNGDPVRNQETSGEECCNGCLVCPQTIAKFEPSVSDQQGV